MRSVGKVVVIVVNGGNRNISAYVCFRAYNRYRNVCVVGSERGALSLAVIFVIERTVRIGSPRYRNLFGVDCERCVFSSDRKSVV